MINRELDATLRNLTTTEEMEKQLSVILASKQADRSWEQDTVRLCYGWGRDRGRHGLRRRAKYESIYEREETTPLRIYAYERGWREGKEIRKQRRAEREAERQAEADRPPACLAWTIEKMFNKHLPALPSCQC